MDKHLLKDAYLSLKIWKMKIWKNNLILRLIKGCCGHCSSVLQVLLIKDLTSASVVDRDVCCTEISNKKKTKAY